MTPLQRVLALAAALLVAAAPGLAAQHPGEVRGVVTDAATSAGLDGVTVSLPGLQRTAVTDAAGRFTLRGIEPGRWTLRFERLGYAARDVRVTARNGETTRLAIRLPPAPLAVTGVTVEASRRAGDEIYLDRAAIDRAGAHTAGDAVRDVPGVVVRSTGPGAPQRVSIRGMAPDAVLVLVDGVPINDPVTGEADLSTIDAASIASITVQPGAQSARWGPRAAAGVIRIETRRGGADDRRLTFGAGSLGTLDAGVAWGGGRPSWTAGASFREQDGDFAFTLPAEVGGGARRRENADLRALAAHAGLGGRAAGGQLDTRIAYDALDRGLPGRGFAPSRHARQRSDRTQGSVAWRREDAQTSVSAAFAAAWQRVSNRDPDPPFGVPYADTVRSELVELRIDATRRLADDDVTVGAGIELRGQRIAATSLAADAPDEQLDAGVFAHGALPIARLHRTDVVVTAQVRADRDPLGGVVASHSLTLGWAPGDIALHIAHRSSYSPPTPGDRFFRDAVGIEPNPDLAAERVPGELEIGARIATALARWPLTLRATAYRGDIDGMILWAPDYRFVWSPYNQDAKRTGAELGAELTSPGRRFRLATGWTVARITYDRDSGDDDVQVAYRPRYTGSIDGTLDLGRTRFDARLRHTGRRTTSPSRANMLPAFWTLDAGVSYERPIAGWSATFELRVDRVFDNDGALIFGYPEPGRVARFGVRLAPGVSQVLSIGAQE